MTDDCSDTPTVPNAEQPRTPAASRVDMTHGSLLRQTVYLSWPIVAASLLQVAVGIADIKMVGVLGPEPIAAVGMARSVIFTLVALVFAVSTGVQVLVAQYSGRGDEVTADRVVKQGLVAATVITLAVITPVGVIFSESILRLLGANQQVLVHGTPYLQIMFAGMLFLVLSFVIVAALQGAGDTLTPLILLLVANVLNIGLNYLLIFGVGPFPRLGVPGAGVAAIVARTLTTLAGLAILISGRFAVSLRIRSSWALRWELIHKIFYLGIPAAIQAFTRNIAFMLIIKILWLTVAGVYAISAWTVAGQIRAVTIMVGLAFMAAATTAVGQNVGANNYQRAQSAGWLSAKLAAGLSVGAALSYALLARILMQLFTDDSRVIAIGVQALVVLAISEPFLTAGMSLSGSLRGAGDTYMPLYVSLTCTSVLAPLAAFVLAIWLGLDTLGVFIGFALAIAVQFGLLAWKFADGYWKDLSVI